MHIASELVQRPFPFSAINLVLLSLKAVRNQIYVLGYLFLSFNYKSILIISRIVSFWICKHKTESAIPRSLEKENPQNRNLKKTALRSEIEENRTLLEILLISE